MARKTLLDITQEIMSAMNSDEVNSITDTAESEAVARIVCSVFDGMVSTKNWPSHKELVQFTASGTSSRPTHMTVPDLVKEIISVRYDKIGLGETRIQFDKVDYLNNDDFLRMTNGRDSTDANIETITDLTGVKLLIKNDKAPTYYTSFNEVEVVFDSYDSDVDTTLQTNKVQALAYIQPESTLSDGWEPDIPKEAEKALIEEAKAVARLQIDDTTDIKAEQESRRQRAWISRNAWKVRGGVHYPNYGRMAPRTKEPTFRKED